MGKSRIELGRYRLFDAREKLRGAEVLLRNSLFKESVARSYYAMFSAVRALLAMEDLDSQKHSGVISLFNKHFVKSGMVSRDLGRLLLSARDYREKGDYGDFVVVTRDEAEEQLLAAKRVIVEITEVIEREYPLG
jgi:uncharacterized protein (UPF0332 family)